MDFNKQYMPGTNNNGNNNGHTNGNANKGRRQKSMDSELQQLDTKLLPRTVSTPVVPVDPRSNHRRGKSDDNANINNPSDPRKKDAPQPSQPSNSERDGNERGSETNPVSIAPIQNGYHKSAFVLAQAVSAPEIRTQPEERSAVHEQTSTSNHLSENGSSKSATTVPAITVSASPASDPAPTPSIMELTSPRTFATAKPSVSLSMDSIPTIPKALIVKKKKPWGERAEAGFISENSESSDFEAFLERNRYVAFACASWSKTLERVASE